jgi:opacity protein-like surface antigen
MKKQFVAGLFAAAMMTPAAALAQDSNETETFIGVSAGYHDLGIGSDEAEGFDIDDASPIFGVVAGVDFPIGGDLIVGAGIDIPLAGGKLRFNVDTVSFDTVRGTTGFVFSF